MRGRSLATGACVLAGLLACGACADRAPSPPTTPTSPTTPAPPTSPTPTPPATEVCAYAPDTTAAVNAVGGTGSAVVRTASACRWTAVTGSSADSWIKIESVPAGLGPGVVAFTLQPNRSFSGRSGTIVIRNDSGEVLATHAVTQRAAGCLYSVSPATQTFDWMGTYDGAGDSPKAIEVRAQPADCQWTAASSVPWVKVVYNSDRGTGNGTIYVSLIQWNSGSPRVGDVVVAGLSGVNPDAHLVVTQGVR